MYVEFPCFHAFDPSKATLVLVMILSDILEFWISYDIECLWHQVALILGIPLWLRIHVLFTASLWRTKEGRWWPLSCYRFVEFPKFDFGIPMRQSNSKFWSWNFGFSRNESEPTIDFLQGAVSFRECNVPTKDSERTGAVRVPPDAVPPEIATWHFFPLNMAATDLLWWGGSIVCIVVGCFSYHHKSIVYHFFIRSI